ncbi:amino acid adenylation domain-containing protein [Spongiimicrobium salis]|uniref:amino acid adenylation domain-containing protein n=1 Tax=Spongiimicrobium salis TaxID=1667022 RepID=UPI00374CEF50
MKLTLPQQDVYFEQLLYPNDPIYNIGAKIEIKGEVSYEILNEAYKKLIDQHDAYRSVILTNTTDAQVMILPEHNSVLGSKDFSKTDDPFGKASDFMRARFSNTFSFTKKQLLHEFTLIKVKKDFYYLFSMYHHIITDGWGTSLMFQRLVTNYNELIEQGKIITEYPFTYSDFVSDDKEYRSSEAYKNDREYWVDKFQQLPDRIFERIDKKSNANKSGRKVLFIDSSKYKKLESMAKQFGGSTFHAILALVYTYFGRKTNCNDLTIGLPVLNRGKSKFKKTVGLFMGVSPLRIQIDFEDTFEKLLLQIKKQLRQDYRYQRFPLGKLVKELGLFLEKDRLFNMTLSYEKQNYGANFKNTKTKVIPLTHESERVALSIYVREFDETQEVKIDFDYNFSYFEEFQINLVVGHFEKLLFEILENPRKKLNEYSYFTASEERLLLTDFNKTFFKYPEKKTVLDFFQRQVQDFPNKIAIADREYQYTYTELNDLTNRIAIGIGRKLKEKKPMPIGIFMERSANMVAMILGVLKTGRPFIPLDPDFPKQRIEYIIDHSKVEAVIGTSTPSIECSQIVTFLNESELLTTNLSEDWISKEVKSSYTAYIIYTSGSTGKPKGVEIGHKSLLNFLLSIQKKPRINHHDVIYSVTTPSFDISYLEFFLPLISGGKLYVTDTETLKDPRKIIEGIEKVKPTMIQATPSFFQMLYNAGWQGNTKLKVLCGGDLLGESLAEKLMGTTSELWNMYGPTETTIWSSTKRILKASEASNIGKPIGNTSFYIFDESLNLLPIGSIGKLYIGGHGLAKGYYRDEILTKEKFIANPFASDEVIYDTGDLGKWNSHGEIEFIGRNDFQVKIRGFRIELGEIEAKLDEMDVIQSSVVIAKRKKEEDAFLVAFIIPKTNFFDRLEIINDLRKELPEYMVPQTIISLKNFPLTQNKKIDRKALSQREIEEYPILSVYQPPKTELQAKLCDCFQEILKTTERIGLNDNFFILGGHSLSAVKLTHFIEKSLLYQISLGDIFQNPTVKELSDYLQSKEKKINNTLKKTPKKPFYPLTPSQEFIWLASQNNHRSAAYNMSAIYKIRGEIEYRILEISIAYAIKRHEALRTNFIERDGIPYQLIQPYDDGLFTIDIKKTTVQEVGNIKKKYTNQAFDLEKELLIKAVILEVNNDEKLLMFNTHHLIMDGWSLELLINEVVFNYRVLSKKTVYKPQELEVQFIDYVDWQQKQALINSPKNLKFWEVYLENYNWMPLFSNEKNPNASEYQLELYQFEWDKDFLNSLFKIIEEKNITLYTLLFSALNIAIGGMRNLKDLCVGSLSSGRNHPDLQNNIGMFVKTLPLRSKLDCNMPISEFLQKTHADILKLDKYQDIPNHVQKNIRLDTIFALQTLNLDYRYIEVDSFLKLIIQPEIVEFARLPLLITMIQKKDGLIGKFQFDPHILSTETISILTMIYEKVLGQIISDPDVLMSSIDTEVNLNEQEKINIDFSFE